MLEEKSLSNTPENKKTHFYCKTNRPLPYVTKLADLGISGKGEVLGAGHLVYLNKNGWEIPPSNFEVLPVLPERFYPPEKTVSGGTNSTIKADKKFTQTAEYSIPVGERHNALFSIAGSLHRQGLGTDTIYMCLKMIPCNPPMSDMEISNIATSISKYKSHREHLNELQERINKKREELGNE
ncbi:hypothetical protein NO1_1367 [Candidatus Termititenax aidoneus]|uniref:Primase C-terminal 1 domain-containing protein n=1 Tax=Termititenax aidoneus TaxID=2218524 RepID=A0A388TBG2_TERA1|nr:hypothetical protein NO1_1367 [Candidatus Termititenax aidoneus]